MTFGLTPEGFNTKRLADVISEAETNLSGIVDPVTGFALQPDFSSNDPAMQIVKVPLDGLGVAWEATQAIADQFDPNNASGPLLAASVQFNGITKDDGTPSTVAIQFTGPAARPIPAGQILADVNTSVLWHTVEDLVSDANGVATTVAESADNGPFEAAPGTVIQLLTSFAGSDDFTLTNTASSIKGEAVESDEDLRKRRDESTLTPAVTPAEAIWGNLRDLQGVSFARVISNRTLLPDANGVPGKSIAAIVSGGSDEDIAAVLLARTSDAAEWFGNTSLVRYDAQGEPYDLRWIRPSDLDIFVEIDLEITNTGAWPSDGPDRIREAVVIYSISGAQGLGIDDGFRQIGFVPGVDVEVSRLYTPINSVPGHRVVGLRVGVTVSPGVAVFIPVAFDQQSRFDVSRIVVNVP